MGDTEKADVEKSKRSEELIECHYDDSWIQTQSNHMKHRRAKPKCHL